jgi:2-polyprenyl-3-methyl-5-hydroxy-6-metoxy-1,4-benzoquinol methylase
VVVSRYDSNDYYGPDGSASRLSFVLNPLLYVLDKLKAHTLIRRVNKNPPGNILDVGAGDGKFLSFARGMGFQPFGTTASNTSAIAAKKLYGIDIEFCEDLEIFSENSIDIITYWHVFEHLSDPEYHVKKWPKLLKKDGVVVIEVPNIGSLGSLICFDSWLGSDVEHHINHMKKDSIVDLVNRSGLNVYKIDHFSLKFSSNEF